MKGLLQRLRYFLFLFGIYVVAGIIIILCTSKSSLFLSINQWHPAVGDALFPWLTYLGHGVAFIVICVISVLYNYKSAILGFLSYIVSGLLAQLLKKLVFPDVARPLGYFKNGPELTIIDGVHPHTMHSFPSGHTASAFALATFLTLAINKPKLGLVFGALAMVIGFSRIYLAQHFFEDVYAGAWLGVITTIIVYLAFEPRLNRSKRLNKGILKRGLGS